MNCETKREFDSRCAQGLTLKTRLATFRGWRRDLLGWSSLSGRYVLSIYHPVQSLELSVAQLCPDVDLSQDILEVQASPSSNAGSPSSMGLPATPPRLQTGDSASLDPDEDDSDEEEADARQALADHLQSVSMEPYAIPHFFGKSSSFTLIQTAMDYKHDGSQKPPRAASQPSDQLPFWEPYNVR